MQIENTNIPGVLLLKPKVFGDSRGWFFEAYRSSYAAQGVDPMVQSNVSHSSLGVLRGLHFQLQQPQAKLVTVLRGQVLDVAVDLRPGSATFGQSVVQKLDGQEKLQLYIPKGFAHGFQVLSEGVDFIYQCSDYYHPESEVTLLWNDPALALPWNNSQPTLSAKDQQGRTLAQLQELGLLPA